MHNLITNIKIQISDKIFVKDPETSALGKKIIKESIILIDEIGFDNFTFKKLGERIGSNESSIYRYFENKHKLLVYLCSWYWSWIEYKMVFKLTNIDDPMERLKRAIVIVTEKIVDDERTEHVNERILNRIVIIEFTKTLYTKEVDEENKVGYFIIYKRLINRMVAIVNEINPDYPFAKSLISTIVKGSLHQHFLKEHLSTITDCNEQVSPTNFFMDLINTILIKE
ncbi:transcriptional regulator, TetR family [Flavobacterium gillisiae]|uniref:Transcriptional regulator, TetR family n=1 Tax=Flavobacterium gillisiae TaxID=150146 RepID=A0A1H3WZY9_9FLAO|nr:TetR/AcrR family transcriptional regulator [Flavobacterium gillisiae]SDZ92550.1 transcriptional regulator, TetR family [Flavobacterium gillisiae]